MPLTRGDGVVSQPQSCSLHSHYIPDSHYIWLLNRFNHAGRHLLTTAVLTTPAGVPRPLSGLNDEIFLVGEKGESEGFSEVRGERIRIYGGS